tara:strand:- start:155 stop:1051 length:897 start_codon:yes stop_codon:yes gene_type:complete
MKSTKLIIVNPVSGNRDGEKKAFYIASLITDHHDVQIIVTKKPGDTEHITYSAIKSGVTEIIICGGDGTIHEVINTVMQESNARYYTKIGIIPAGTCNNFAHDLGLPYNLQNITDVILKNNIRKVDLANIGYKYYATIATLGFDSEVAQYVKNQSYPSYLQGTTAYLWGLFATLKRYQNHNVTLLGDFGEIEEKIFLVATANTQSYGGKIRIAPSAKPTDGMLTICIVQALPKKEIIRMVPTIFRGTHIKHPKVNLYKTRELTIKSEDSLWIWADGEQITKTPATIKIAPKVLSVICP